MLRTIIIGVLVLLLQTSFYIKAGNHVSISTNALNQGNFDVEEEFNHVLLSKDVLFVVKHSKSPNVVVYQANRTTKKDLDPKKPIDVYWLMNTKGKKIEALTFLEWKMAFGFKLTTILKGKKYKISLNAIKDREIIISQNQLGDTETIMEINGVLSKLKNVFIKFEYSFALPDVEYVDFSGVNMVTGKLITERILAD